MPQTGELDLSLGVTLEFLPVSTDVSVSGRFSTRGLVTLTTQVITPVQISSSGRFEVRSLIIADLEISSSSRHTTRGTFRVVTDLSIESSGRSSFRSNVDLQSVNVLSTFYIGRSTSNQVLISSHEGGRITVTLYRIL